MPGVSEHLVQLMLLIAQYLSAASSGLVNSSKSAAATVSSNDGSSVPWLAFAFAFTVGTYVRVSQAFASMVREGAIDVTVVYLSC